MADKEKLKELEELKKECMYSKDNYTDEDRKALCDGCEEECRFNKKEESINNGLDLGCGVIWKDENPVSEPQVKESAKTQHVNKTCKENGNSLTQEPASEDLEKEVYEHLWKGRMGTDVSKPIYFSYDELLEVASHFAAWQKQQMMNNAITAEYWDNSLMLDAEMRGKYSDGNMLKLIIIKED